MKEEADQRRRFSIAQSLLQAICLKIRRNIKQIVENKELYRHLTYDGRCQRQVVIVNPNQRLDIRLLVK